LILTEQKPFAQIGIPFGKHARKGLDVHCGSYIMVILRPNKGKQKSPDSQRQAIVWLALDIGV